MSNKMKLLIIACVAVIVFMVSGTLAKPKGRRPQGDLSEFDPLCFCNISGDGINGGKPMPLADLECNLNTLSECKSICEEHRDDDDDDDFGDDDEEEHDNEDDDDDDDIDDEVDDSEDDDDHKGGRRHHSGVDRHHGRGRPRDHHCRICCKNNITSSIQVRYFAWISSTSPECDGLSADIREETIDCTGVECPPENQRPQNRPPRGPRF